RRLVVDVLVVEHAPATELQHRDHADDLPGRAGNRDGHLLDAAADPLLQQAAIRDPEAVEPGRRVVERGTAQPGAPLFKVDGLACLGPWRRCTRRATFARASQARAPGFVEQAAAGSTIAVLQGIVPVVTAYRGWPATGCGGAFGSCARCILAGIGRGDVRRTRGIARFSRGAFGVRLPG